MAHRRNPFPHERDRRDPPDIPLPAYAETSARVRALYVSAAHRSLNYGLQR